MSDEPDETEELVEVIPNAADPKANTEAKKRQRFKIDQRTEFWRITLNNPVGRMVLWDLFADLGTFEDKFATTPVGFPDAAAREFYAGQKAFGLRLYRTLMIAEPNCIVQMHIEHDPAFRKPKPPRKPRDDG